MTHHNHTPQALSSLAPAGATAGGAIKVLPVPPAIPFPDPRNHFEEIANAIVEAKLEAI